MLSLLRPFVVLCASTLQLEAGLLLDDEVRHRKREAVLHRRSASLLEPRGLLVGTSDDDQLLGLKVSERILDRVDRVGVADARLDVVAGNCLGDLPGPPTGLGPGVVLRVRQPVELRDLRCRGDDEQLRILSRVRTDTLAKLCVRDRSGRNDKDAAGHDRERSRYAARHYWPRRRHEQRAEEICEYRPDRGGAAASSKERRWVHGTG
jgi:hypothetical protein